MKTIALALVTLLALPGLAAAQDTKASIAVTHPWLRATPKNAPVAGGYATLTNTGSVPDTLVSASLPMAPKGEVHTMTMANGVMHMSRLDAGLQIAPGATVTLAPGGYHLMFAKPTAPLKQGESVKGSLTFTKAGTIDVTFVVAGMGAKSAPGVGDQPGAAMKGMDMKGMDMKGMDMKGMH